MLCVAFAAKGAGKQTFNALTLTRLSGLHHKERWLAFGASLAEEETIKVSAERCTIAPSTAHRWRHLFLVALRQATGPACRNYGGGRDLPVGELQGPAADRAPPPPAMAAARPASLASRAAGAHPGGDRPQWLHHGLSPGCGQRRQPEEGAGASGATDALLVCAANRCYPPVARALNIPTRAPMPQPERGSAPLYQP